LVGAVLWSTGGYFIKEIDAGAVTITCYRCLFSAVWLLPFMPGRGLPRASDAVVSIALFTGLLALYVGSTKETTAANAIFLQYTAPIYVILLAPFLLNERLRSVDAIPIGICLAGIGILFFGNRGSDDATGLWMGLGSGVFYGLFLVWLRKMRYADPIAVTFVNCLGVALVLAPFASVLDVDGGTLGLLALMALIQFAVPYVFFTTGLRYVGSAEASLIALIEPVLNPIWVFLLLGEEPSTATVVGGAVIIGGLALRYLFLRPKEDRLATESAEVTGPI
jgi:drug/metabolite transporter (DMT)-like permease